MSLAEKRIKIISEHQAMEKYDPYWRDLAKQGDRVSERPIAFLCDDEVIVLGDCVPKIMAGIKIFIDKIAVRQQDHLCTEPATAQAIRKCTTLYSETPPAEIRVPQQWWNAYLFGLNEAGVNVVLADGLH